MKPARFSDGTPMHIPELVRRPQPKPAGCSCSSLSPFLYRCHPRESIFVGSPGFGVFGGKTASQRQAEAVETQLQTYGRSMALPWITKPGPVTDPKKLSVSRKAKK